MMRSYCLYLFMLILLVGGMPQATLAESSYRVAAGDVISVLVFDEPDLTMRQARISADGTIAFPLLGEIHVDGMTIQAVEQRIETLLLDGYLKHPKVTVSIDQYRSFFVHGAVKSPGAYQYQTGLTVHKAVVLAGGFSERASKSKITIATEKKPEQLRPVRLADPVQPGDVITVGESFF